jgi:hypothetical protein
MGEHPEEARQFDVDAQRIRQILTTQVKGRLRPLGCASAFNGGETKDQKSEKNQNFDIQGRSHKSLHPRKNHPAYEENRQRKKNSTNIERTQY